MTALQIFENIHETMTRSSYDDSSKGGDSSNAEDSLHDGHESSDEGSQKGKQARKKARLDHAAKNLHLAPLEVPSLVGSIANIATQHPIIVLLDQASVETVKSKRGVFELLNCDDHRDLCMKKLRKDPNDYRPDILHQELLSLLDSPLNKAGLLKVYVQTNKRVLIDINSSIRIPRTYKRFAGLMVQLLHKMKIKASSESTTLLKVIKNPFSQYLPAGTRCYGFSCKGTLYSPIALAKELLPLSPHAEGQPPTCFILGAMSTGHITIEDHPYIEKMLSISEYPLSGAAAASRIMGGIEHHWGII